MSPVDVVVVGAGFAGLTAARRLHAVGVGVAVCEAATRVGGRTDTVHRDGRWLEAGGQWIGPGQHRVSALADEFGVARFPTPGDGVHLQLVAGEVAPLADDPPYAPVVAELDALATEVPVDEPWRATDARSLDALDVSAWLNRTVSQPAARRSSQRVFEGLMTVPAEEMSLLTLLHAARTSGTMAAALGTEGGAQEQRLAGGLHQLAQLMADELAGCLHLDTPVTVVRQNAAGLAIETTSGEITCSRVIVAVPPSALLAITFDPELPAPCRELSRLMPLGSVIKAQVVFERPFWADTGLSGMVVADTGPFEFMVDNSSPDSDAGVLATFLSAGAARRCSDHALGRDAASVRQRMLMDHVQQTLGPQIPEPIDYFDRDWSAVPWIGGGYSGVMRPGGWLHAGTALREPVGRVHWASAESALEWNGYVEGAIEAGERVARDVLTRL